MSDPTTLQLQRDLATLGYNPGPLDGLRGKKTSGALRAWADARGLDLASPRGELFPRLHAEAEAEAKRALSPVVKVQGDKSKLKPKVRDFSRQPYFQIHQTDFWAKDDPGTLDGMKTNLYCSTQAVYAVHPPEAIVEDNYSDFYHLEVSWVSASRKTVTDKKTGRVYHREPGVWTEWREGLLERAIAYGVEQLRAHGVEPILITHRQTYKDRAIDPDLEIAQATYRIAQRRGYKLDFEWVRGSGQSAALWYPTGCGRLG